MILLKFSYISGFDHISSQDGWFTSQKWHNEFLLRKFLRFLEFPDFSRIFFKSSYFSEILWYLKITNIAWKFFFRINPVFRFTRIFLVFLQILTVFTSDFKTSCNVFSKLIRKDYFLFQNISGFRIFLEFSSNLHVSFLIICDKLISFFKVDMHHKCHDFFHDFNLFF